MEPEVKDIGFLTKPAIGLIDLILSNIKTCCVTGDETAGDELMNILQITNDLKATRDYISNGERIMAMNTVHKMMVGADCDYLKSVPIADKNIPEACRAILIYQIQQELMMLRQLLIP